MIEELNTKIFFDDPCRKLHEEYSSMDIENNNLIKKKDIYIRKKKYVRRIR